MKKYIMSLTLVAMLLTLSCVPCPAAGVVSLGVAADSADIACDGTGRPYVLFTSSNLVQIAALMGDRLDAAAVAPITASVAVKQKYPRLHFAAGRFYTAYTGRDWRTGYFLSYDPAAGWTGEMFATDRFLKTSYPTVVTDAAGNVYIAATRWTDGGAGEPVGGEPAWLWIKRPGQSWQARVLSPEDGRDWRALAATTADGNAYISVRAWGRPGTVYVSRAGDLEPLLTTPRPRGLNPLLGEIAIDGGHVYVAAAIDHGGLQDIAVAVDGGAWETIRRDIPATGYDCAPDIVVRDGVIALLWAEKTANGFDIYLWPGTGAPVTLASGVSMSDEARPAMACSRAGLVAVWPSAAGLQVWRETDGAAPSDDVTPANPPAVDDITARLKAALPALRAAVPALRDLVAALATLEK